MGWLSSDAVGRCDWVGCAGADSAMDSILKTLDERKFEEAAEVQATNDSLRAHWRMQTDRSLRPEWDIIDPDTLKKVRVDATRGYKLAGGRCGG